MFNAAGLGAIPTTMDEAVRQLRGQRGSATQDYWFGYTADFVNIPQNNEASVSVQTDQGSDFLIKGVAFSAWITATTTPTGLPARMPLIANPIPATAAEAALYGYTSQTLLRWQMTNRPFMSEPIRGSAFNNLPGNILWLTDWIYIPGNSGILTRVTNLLPALTGQASPGLDAQVVFVGLRSDGVSVRRG